MTGEAQFIVPYRHYNCRSHSFAVWQNHPVCCGAALHGGFCNANSVLEQTYVKTCSHCQTSSAFLSRNKKRRNNVLSGDLQEVAASVQLQNALPSRGGGKPVQITGSRRSDRAPGARVRCISLSSVIICRFLWQVVAVICQSWSDSKRIFSGAILAERGSEVHYT